MELKKETKLKLNKYEKQTLIDAANVLRKITRTIGTEVNNLHLIESDIIISSKDIATMFANLNNLADGDILVF